MRWNVSRCALVVCLSSGLLTACELREDAGGAPSATVISQEHLAPRSWIDPAASGRDLVYVSAQSEVDVYTYPRGKLVGKLSAGFSDATGLCSDTKGNVWIVNPNYLGTSTLVEYAHGGNTPIATLQDGTKHIPDYCALDPVTGNLAVANTNGDVAIYANAQGSPTYYSTNGLANNVRTVAYDGSGDLYLRSFNRAKAAAWLPNGSSTVAPFLVRRLGYYDWDGKYLAIDAGGVRKSTLARYSLNGASGTKVGSVRLNGCQKAGVFSIAGSELAVICGAGILYYRYPSAGDPIKKVRVDSAGGAVISVAP